MLYIHYSTMKVIVASHGSHMDQELIKVYIMQQHNFCHCQTKNSARF